MANLGSDNTPIEGESFGLPSGYSFDEENGDLVIRDTDGTVAMRRADGTWELESDLALNENGISGVGGFDSESLNTESATIGGQANITATSIDKTDETVQIPIPDKNFIRIYFSKLTPSSRGEEVRLRFSDDGGQTFADEDDDYAWRREQIASDGDNRTESNASSSIIKLGENFNRRGGSESVIILDLTHPQDGDRETTLSWRGAFARTADRVYNVSGSGKMQNNLSVDTIKVFGSDNESMGDVNAVIRAWEVM